MNEARISRWLGGRLERRAISDRERPVETLHVLWTRLGVQVALDRGQLRVAEEPLHPADVGLAGDERAGAVAERVEAEHAEACAGGGTLEPLAQRRTVEWPVRGVSRRRSRRAR